MFHWDRDMLEGATPESRAARDVIDQWWAIKLGIPDFTPRMALQQFGTEVMRNSFHDDMWILSLQRKLELAEPSANIVVTDVRFPNEIAMIKELGGTCIRVKRGENPDWWDLAVSSNKVGMFEAIEDLGIHESEYRWIGQEFDHEITNDGSFIDLQIKVNDLVSNCV
jgi:hypothetical protein